MIELHKATPRETELHWVRCAGVHILFSYSTPVAFSASGIGSFRRGKDWGPTTHRHMTRDTSVWHYAELSEEDFNRKMEDALFQAILNALPREVISRAIGKKVSRTLLGEPA